MGHNRRRSRPDPNADSVIRRKEFPALLQGAQFGADTHRKRRKRRGHERARSWTLPDASLGRVADGNSAGHPRLDRDSPKRRLRLPQHDRTCALGDHARAVASTQEMAAPTGRPSIFAKARALPNAFRRWPSSQHSPGTGATRRRARTTRDPMRLPASAPCQRPIPQRSGACEKSSSSIGGKPCGKPGPGSKHDRRASRRRLNSS